MKNSKNIQEFFNQKKNELNIEQMNSGHEKRFIEKLNNNKKPIKKTYWSYYAAAMLILCITASSLLFENNLEDSKVFIKTTKIDFPKEVANAQFHFEGVIKKELLKIELERNNDTHEIIENAFSQLIALEKEQQNLQERLNISYDKRIVKALINNFQHRIQLLENVMKQIEIIKEIKTLENETIL